MGLLSKTTLNIIAVCPSVSAPFSRNQGQHTADPFALLHANKARPPDRIAGRVPIDRCAALDNRPSVFNVVLDFDV